jgi:hypothetical protein
MLLNDYIVTIDSKDRNTSLYPNASVFSIALPQRYRNVVQADLLNAIYMPTVPRYSHVFISIDKLNKIDSTGNAGVNFAFAKLPAYLTVLGNVYVDATNTTFGDRPMLNPIATLDRLNFRVIDNAGELIDLNGNNWSCQLRLVCGALSPTGGGSTITTDGRVLGGTR